MDTSVDNILDLVGEVANTISGNARKVFGREFLISVPVMIEGAVDKIYTQTHPLFCDSCILEILRRHRGGLFGALKQATMALLRYL